MAAETLKPLTLGLNGGRRGSRGHNLAIGQLGRATGAFAGRIGLGLVSRRLHGSVDPDPLTGDLAVRPPLDFWPNDGEPDPLDRVRTGDRAYDRLVNQARTRSTSQASSQIGRGLPSSIHRRGRTLAGPRTAPGSGRLVPNEVRTAPNEATRLAPSASTPTAGGSTTTGGSNAADLDQLRASMHAGRPTKQGSTPSPSGQATRSVARAKPTSPGPDAALVKGAGAGGFLERARRSRPGPRPGRQPRPTSPLQASGESGSSDRGRSSGSGTSSGGGRSSGGSTSSGGGRSSGSNSSDDGPGPGPKPEPRAPGRPATLPTTTNALARALATSHGPNPDRRLGSGQSTPANQGLFDHDQIGHSQIGPSGRPLVLNRSNVDQTQSSGRPTFSSAADGLAVRADANGWPFGANNADPGANSPTATRSGPTIGRSPIAPTAPAEAQAQRRSTPVTLNRRTTSQTGTQSRGTVTPNTAEPAQTTDQTGTRSRGTVTRNAAEANRASVEGDTDGEAPSAMSVNASGHDTTTPSTDSAFARPLTLPTVAGQRSIVDEPTGAMALPVAPPAVAGLAKPATESAPIGANGSASTGIGPQMNALRRPAKSMSRFQAIRQARRSSEPRTSSPGHYAPPAPAAATEARPSLPRAMMVPELPATVSTSVPMMDRSRPANTIRPEASLPRASSVPGLSAPGPSASGRSVPGSSVPGSSVPGSSVPKPPLVALLGEHGNTTALAPDTGSSGRLSDKDNSNQAPRSTSLKDGRDREVGESPSRDLGSRFLAELRREHADKPRKLPGRFDTLARAIAGPTTVGLVTGASTQRALATVGKKAATIGSNIFLASRPGSASRDDEIIGHELTHVARPSPLPRFFDDNRHSAEERLAGSVGRQIGAAARQGVAPSIGVLARAAGTPTGHQAPGSSAAAPSTMARSFASRLPTAIPTVQRSTPPSSPINSRSPVYGTNPLATRPTGTTSVMPLSTTAPSTTSRSTTAPSTTSRSTAAPSTTSRSTTARSADVAPNLGAALAAARVEGKVEGKVHRRAASSATMGHRVLNRSTGGSVFGGGPTRPVGTTGLPVAGPAGSVGQAPSRPASADGLEATSQADQTSPLQANSQTQGQVPHRAGSQPSSQASSSSSGQARIQRKADSTRNRAAASAGPTSSEAEGPGAVADGGTGTGGTSAAAGGSADSGQKAAKPAAAAFEDLDDLIEKIEERVLHELERRGARFRGGF